MSVAAARQQGTVASPVQSEGLGLHTGGSHRVTILPASADHGIVFRQIDRRDTKTDIPANWRCVRELPLCTCLAAAGRAQVRTVEHLLAACYACGVDSALIEVRGSEIPILDGSAQPWIELIRAAGVTRLEKPRKRLRILQPVTVEDGARRISIRPARYFSVKLRTSVRGFGTSRWQGRMNRKIFREEISKARSFGRLRLGLLAKLFTRFHRDPLCQGANLSSVVAVARGRVLNPGGLRYPDEFVRHRVLDLMGDLMLGGADLIGRIDAQSPVHSLNRRFLEELLSAPLAWERVA
jgi:UDP-3-O-[3-hydroxymyristoyl] N-acetylglucosamine deacetylase